MNRRLVILLGVAGFLVLGLFAKGIYGVIQGDDDVGAPPTAELLPVPDGAAVVADATEPGEGSLGADRRLVVLDASQSGVPARQVAVSYLEGLRSRGWTITHGTGALSPDTTICLTAETMADYLADAGRPEVTKQRLRDLGRAPDSVAVITAIFC